MKIHSINRVFVLAKAALGDEVVLQLVLHRKFKPCRRPGPDISMSAASTSTYPPSVKIDPEANIVGRKRWWFYPPEVAEYLKGTRWLFPREFRCCDFDRCWFNGNVVQFIKPPDGKYIYIYIYSLHFLGKSLGLNKSLA